MAKTSVCGRLLKGGFGGMLVIMRKLRTSLSHSTGVKQGHFVVIATQGWKPERFFVKLSYLDHPEFVKLLEQAEEEFGFSQVGALEIPCEPGKMIRCFVGSMIRKGLSVLFVARRWTSSVTSSSEEEVMYFNDDETVEGYFTVLATKGKETRRFSVELDCLSDGAFLGLLDEAPQNIHAQIHISY
ncbi:hypothetical protein PIB30_073892 [Stylosanthes scabra]|uniref:Uncharacterized protein n=1 Tax=Stylosanthes scabra TaxID=79078 RepID=A0ABU6ZN48_9FABA|nr:hypothetical protein [Stylosanthes scabra]